MKSDNITVYRLKEDWEPFDKGTEFIYDDGRLSIGNCFRTKEEALSMVK